MNYFSIFFKFTKSYFWKTDIVDWTRLVETSFNIDLRYCLCGSYIASEPYTALCYFYVGRFHSTTFFQSFVLVTGKGGSIGSAVPEIWIQTPLGGKLVGNNLFKCKPYCCLFHALCTMCIVHFIPIANMYIQHKQWVMNPGKRVITV